ncbi:MAG: hypothetical protein IKT00_13135 [Prevotella sp.]|nr:hypothetical protein [Prevotella sp.]
MSKLLHSCTPALLLITLVGFAVSCKTTKSSVSVRGKCETLSQSSERLCTSLSIDTISKYFALNADSLIITFVGGEQNFTHLSPLTSHPSLSASMPSPNDLTGSLDDVYAFSDKHHAAAQPSAHTDGAHTAHSSPPSGRVRVGVYGLHTSSGSSKQSIQQSSLADSNDKSEQSASIKEDIVKKSSPVPLARYIFFFLLMAGAIYIIYKVRR